MGLTMASDHDPVRSAGWSTARRVVRSASCRRVPPVSSDACVSVGRDRAMPGVRVERGAVGYMNSARTAEALRAWWAWEAAREPLLRGYDGCTVQAAGTDALIHDRVRLQCRRRGCHALRGARGGADSCAGCLCAGPGRIVSLRSLVGPDSILLDETSVTVDGRVVAELPPAGL